MGDCSMRTPNGRRAIDLSRQSDAPLSCRANLLLYRLPPGDREGAEAAVAERQQLVTERRGLGPAFCEHPPRATRQRCLDLGRLFE
jgi:hypothetical protein